jgi:hypothetical protein
MTFLVMVVSFPNRAATLRGFVENVQGKMREVPGLESVNGAAGLRRAFIPLTFEVSYRWPRSGPRLEK